MLTEMCVLAVASVVGLGGICTGLFIKIERRLTRIETKLCEGEDCE